MPTTQPGSTRFSRAHRLLTPADYKRVFDAPDLRVSNRELLMLARFQIPGEPSPPRLGTVVSRKNARLAVQRNRFKRHCREGFRHRQEELGGLDIIVLARRGVDQLDAPTLRLKLDQLWSQLQRRARSRRQPS